MGFLNVQDDLGKIVACLTLLSCFLPSLWAFKGVSVTYTSEPAVIVAGKQARLQFKMVDALGHPIPWEDLAVVHDRRLHVVFIGEDMDVLGHVHPEDFGAITDEMSSSGIYPVLFTFPRGGRYAIALDYALAPNTGGPYGTPNTAGADTGAPEVMYLATTLELTVQGLPRMQGPSAESLDTSPHRTFSFVPSQHPSQYTSFVSFAELAAQAARAKGRGTDASGGSAAYTFEMDANGGAPVYVGTCARVVFTISGADGTPVTDLSPYLSAPMHVAIVRQDLELGTMQHVHGMLEDGTGTGGSMGDTHGNAGMGMGMDMDMGDVAASAGGAMASPTVGGARGDMEDGADYCHDSYQHMAMGAPPASFGPHVVIYVRFGAPGKHTIFLQTAHKGRLLFARFIVDVAVVQVGVSWDPPAPLAHVPCHLVVSLQDVTGSPVPWSRMVATHERRMHVTVISEDLDTVVLLHPEDVAALGEGVAAAPGGNDPSRTPGEFVFPITFPRAGRHAVLIELAYAPPPPLGTAGTTHAQEVVYVEQRLSVDVGAGASGAPRMSTPRVYKLTNDASMLSIPLVTEESIKEQGGPVGRLLQPLVVLSATQRDGDDDGYHASLKANGGRQLFAGQCVPLLVEWMRGRGRMPMMDLQPYLNASMHVVLVREDLDPSSLRHGHGMSTPLLPSEAAQHDLCEEHHQHDTHPGDPGRPFGPFAIAHMRFGSPGRHMVLAYAQRGQGELLLAKFVVDVCAPPSELRWSDKCSWTSPPEAGADVHIPQGVQMVLDVSPPPLKTLRVQGALVVEDGPSAAHGAPWQVSLQAGAIIVQEGGLLQAGTRAQPFRSRLDITLTDDGPSECGLDLLSGSRLLASAGGTVQLIAATPSGASSQADGWGRLGAPVAAQASQLSLGEVPWGPCQEGDVLVLASSDGDPQHTEEVTVASASGSTVHLRSPTQFLHDGELALLRRTIRVAAAAPSSGTQSQGGGRVLVVSPSREGEAMQPQARRRKLMGATPLPDAVTGGSAISVAGGTGKGSPVATPPPAAAISRLPTSMGASATGARASDSRQHAVDLNDVRGGHLLWSVVNDHAVDGVAQASSEAGRQDEGSAQDSLGPSIAFERSAAPLVAQEGPVGQPGQGMSPQQHPGVHQQPPHQDRRQLHSGSGAYWSDVPEGDAAVSTAGDGRLEMYLAPPAKGAPLPPLLVLRGVELSGMGSRGMARRPAVYIDPSVTLPSGGESVPPAGEVDASTATVSLEGCSIHHSLSQCVAVAGGIGGGCGRVLLAGNVCHQPRGHGIAVGAPPDDVWTPLPPEGVPFEDPTGAGGRVPGACAVELRRNLVVRPLAEERHLAQHWSDSTPAGIFVDNVVPLRGGFGARSPKAVAPRVYLRDNVVLASAGHGVVWGAHAVGDAGHNTVHSNALIGLVMGSLPIVASASRYNVLASPGRAALPTPAWQGAVAGGSGPLVTAFGNGMAQACSRSARAAAVLLKPTTRAPLVLPTAAANAAAPVRDEWRVPVLPLQPGVPTPIIRIVSKPPRLTYYSLEVPPEVGDVMIVIKPVPSDTGRVGGQDLVVLLNAWGRLPCKEGFIGCDPNPAAKNKKTYDFGKALRLEDNAAADQWMHPNYNHGTWYLGVGGEDSSFTIEYVRFGECKKGQNGFWIAHQHSSARYKCVDVIPLPLNQPLHGLQLRGKQGMYFYFDAPPRVSQLYVMVNKTSATTRSQIVFQARSGVIPNYKDVDGATFRVNGVTGADMSDSDVVPEAVFSFVRRNLDSGRYYIAVTQVTTSYYFVDVANAVTTFSITAAVDACGPEKMSDTYYLPPHHEEDLVRAARTKPPCKPCNQDVHYIPMDSTYRGVQQRVGLSPEGGQRAGYQRLFRLTVPHLAPYLNVTVQLSAPDGFPLSAMLYLTRGNLPTLVDAEDYLFWTFDYSMELKAEAGGAAAGSFQVSYRELYGHWGDWYAVLQWSQLAEGHPFAIRVEAGATNPPLGEPSPPPSLSSSAASWSPPQDLMNIPWNAAQPWGVGGDCLGADFRSMTYEQQIAAMLASVTDYSAAKTAAEARQQLLADARAGQEAAVRAREQASSLQAQLEEERAARAALEATVAQLRQQVRNATAAVAAASKDAATVTDKEVEDSDDGWKPRLLRAAVVAISVLVLLVLALLIMPYEAAWGERARTLASLAGGSPKPRYSRLVDGEAEVGGARGGERGRLLAHRSDLLEVADSDTDPGDAGEASQHGRGDVVVEMEGQGVEVGAPALGASSRRADKGKGAAGSTGRADVITAAMREDEEYLAQRIDDSLPSPSDAPLAGDTQVELIPLMGQSKRR
eukprot:jgi/Mesvir1/19463/Mv10489-RA.2